MKYNFCLFILLFSFTTHASQVQHLIYFSENSHIDEMKNECTKGLISKKLKNTQYSHLKIINTSRNYWTNPFGEKLFNYEALDEKGDLYTGTIRVNSIKIFNSQKKEKLAQNLTFGVSCQTPEKKYRLFGSTCKKMPEGTFGLEVYRVLLLKNNLDEIILEDSYNFPSHSCHN